MVTLDSGGSAAQLFGLLPYKNMPQFGSVDSSYCKTAFSVQYIFVHKQELVQESHPGP